MKVVRLCATLLALCSWSGITLAAVPAAAQESNPGTTQDAAADWLTGFEFTPSGAAEPPRGKRGVHADIL